MAVHPSTVVLAVHGAAVAGLAVYGLYQGTQTLWPGRTGEIVTLAVVVAQLIVTAAVIRLTRRRRPAAVTVAMTTTDDRIQPRKLTDEPGETVTPPA